MAEIPELVEIVTGDYPEEYKDVIDRLGLTLNNFLRQVHGAMSNALTFQENFNASVKTFNIKGSDTLTFASPITDPIGVVLLKYRNTTDPTEVLTTAVSVPQWAPDGAGNITIQPIPGLTSADNYDIILLIIAE